MTWLRQAAEHDTDHGKMDEDSNDSAVALEIARHISSINETESPRGDFKR
jgi:hypothetical protein